MSSFSLPSSYQPMLGKNFFERQISNVADALPGVIARGLSKTPTVTPPNTGLPDVSEIDKPKTPTMLYVGVGVGAVVLLAVLLGKKKSSTAKA